MTITELYEKLADKGFQDHETGNLFFPAYMYAYPAEKEYEIEAEIKDIKDRLHRPSNYLDILVLDIFDEFLEYLENEKFGPHDKLKFYLENEPSNPGAVQNALKKDAYDERFLKRIHKQIQEHFDASGEHEVAYVFVKGFSRAFPYIRASRFMNRFEHHIKGYKLLMFYPGAVKEYYSLFGLLKDENLYRAIKLINS